MQHPSLGVNVFLSASERKAQRRRFGLQSGREVEGHAEAGARGSGLGARGAGFARAWRSFDPIQTNERQGPETRGSVVAGFGVVYQALPNNEIRSEDAPRFDRVKLLS